MNETLSHPFVENADFNEKTEESYLAAFDDLAPKLYRFCLLRVGSKPLAEDLVSDAFLKTWNYLKQGEEIQSFPTFLYKVVQNSIIDHYRSRAHKEILINEDLTEILVDSSDPVEEVEKNLEISRVIEGLRTLPAHEAKIVYWRFVDGLSIKEIAELSGKKPNAVYVSIFRGVQKLKNTFNDHKQDYV